MAPATRTRPRWTTRLGLTAAAIAAVFVSSAAPAAAHVTLEGIVANGDGTVTLTFAFDHGCGDSPTNELHVSLPDGVEVTSTTEPPGWAAEPRDGSLRWTGPPIASGEAARYQLTTPAFGRAGETIWFPVVQRCVEGELPWIATDPAATDPAPFVVLDATTAGDPAPPAPPEEAGDGATPAHIWSVSLAAMTTAALLGRLFGPARRERSRVVPDSLPDDGQ